ncbi:MAG TPA: hypothetical protein VEJ84_23735 [Acidimicrobiales bacterium]|nr:hypothetical protein [Acidimicrobiales bacterium]
MGTNGFGMARQFEYVVHFGSGDEGTSALVAVDPLLSFELIESLADSPPRNPIPFAELAFGRYARPSWEFPDEGDEGVTQEAVLRVPRTLVVQSAVGRAPIAQFPIAQFPIA